MYILFAKLQQLALVSTNSTALEERQRLEVHGLLGFLRELYELQ